MQVSEMALRCVFSTQGICERCQGISPSDSPEENLKCAQQLCMRGCEFAALHCGRRV